MQTIGWLTGSIVHTHRIIGIKTARTIGESMIHQQMNFVFIYVQTSCLATGLAHKSKTKHLLCKRLKAEQISWLWWCSNSLRSILWFCIMQCERSFIFIDRIAGEIIRLVASVCVSVRLTLIKCIYYIVTSSNRTRKQITEIWKQQPQHQSQC